MGEDKFRTAMQLIGNHPKTRILFFLIEMRDFRDEGDGRGWNRLDIMKNLGVTSRTLKYFIPQLLEEKSIITVRKIGKMCFYEVNEDSNFIKYMIQLWENGFVEYKDSYS